MPIETDNDELLTSRQIDANQQISDKPTRVGTPLGDDYLLTKEDVAAIARCGDDVARDLIHETAKGIKAHTRLYVFDSDLHDYFKSLRGNL